MTDYILETEILFNDIQAEKLGTEPEDVWGKFYLDLREVAGFGEFVKDGIPDSQVTEVTIKNVGGRIINIPVRDMKKRMEGIWQF